AQAKLFGEMLAEHKEIDNLGEK
ncbi:hypothetical protein LCGC14_1191900, partial [marine sediment metagenome]